ncbi:MAG: hypothetical protein PHV59_06630 [Victivallales bacterium]|nr:hypothetical protein [Victivallales bacterium]
MRFLVFILMVAALPPSNAETPLKVPAAPFVNKESAVSREKPKMEFDPAGLTYHFGSKKIIFRPNGSFQIYSRGKPVADVYWFFGTNYSGWQPNNVARKLEGEYKTGPLCFTECTVDENAKSITIKGLLPFHKKESSVPVLGHWTQVVKLTPDEQLDFRLDFTIPEGEKILDGGSKTGMIFRIPLARGYRTEKHGEDLFSATRSRTYSRYGYPGEYILVLMEDPVDSFRVLIPPDQKKKARYMCYGKGRSFRVSPDHIILDLMEYGDGDGKKVPGGVDFQKSDCLSVPERGRNLLLNPYFAQGYAYLNTDFFHTRAYAPKTADKTLNGKDAKFGKYSLETGGDYFLSPVPAEPGKYVFSFYAKGKGTLSVRFQDEAFRNVSKNGNFRAQINSPAEWKRFEFPFVCRKRGLLQAFLVSTSMDGAGLIDGLQLEKGSKATEFDAPPVTARLLTEPKDGFFESGKPFRAGLELSTLEKQVSGKGTAKITDFFGETVFKHDFDFSLHRGKYPWVDLPINEKLSDGIYVLHLEYTFSDNSKRNEYFRFSIMPFLRNEHKTARVFSVAYSGGTGFLKYISERLLARKQAIGIGMEGHMTAMTRETLNQYNKYRIIPFD